jgi:hypothetical protein
MLATKVDQEPSNTLAIITISKRTNVLKKLRKLLTDVKQLEKKTKAQTETKIATQMIMKMIEKETNKSIFPIEKQNQDLLNVMVNLPELMILTIRHLVCIKKRAKNSTLRNLNQNKKTKKPSKMKTKTSNKSNTKNRTLKPKKSKQRMKMKMVLMRRKKRRNNQRQSMGN